ncbi:MAG TPA: hypothetical protein VHB25_01585 [Gemmatimonadaceae bacterium]|nr:hypothetical protein [Gemmatimonadaceae bacterium]
MKWHHLLAVGALSAILAVPAHAQSVKKVAADVHHTLKKAGNDVKAAAKDAGSAAHHTLKKTGNAAKDEAGEVTGVHKVGGDVGKAAKAVSKTGKKTARHARHALKKTKAAAHDSLTKAGKSAKAQVKKP